MGAGDSVTSGRQFAARDAILAAPDRAIEELEIPEWGTWVRVQAWDGATRWKVLQGWPRDGRPTVNHWALVAMYSVVDETGERLFGDGDLDELTRKSARALDRIFTTALRLNGLDQGAPERLGKDSASTANGASTSSSPATSAG